jgi:hypothetical protein
MESIPRRGEGGEGGKGLKGGGRDAAAHVQVWSSRQRHGLRPPSCRAGAGDGGGGGAGVAKAERRAAGPASSAGLRMRCSPCACCCCCCCSRLFRCPAVRCRQGPAPGGGGGLLLPLLRRRWGVKCAGRPRLAVRHPTAAPHSRIRAAGRVHLAGHRRPPPQTPAPTARRRAAARFQPARRAVRRVGVKGEGDMPSQDFPYGGVNGNIPPSHAARAQGGRCAGSNARCLLTPREHSRTQFHRRVERGWHWYPIHHRQV